MKSNKQAEKKPEKDVSAVRKFFSTMFRTKKVAAVGMVILILFVLIAIFADVLAPQKTVDGVLPTSMLKALKPPSREYPFGTDALGRDLLSYMIYGARTSVILGVCGTLISTVISVLIGVSSATIGGKFDLILQRFIDGWNCIPAMLIVMILMSILGSGLVQMVIVLSVPVAIGTSRMIRSAAISVKDSGYVHMSHMLGAGTWWKMLRHVIPNVLPLVLMNMANVLGGVVMMEATLNFLGFGVSVGTPSWGALLTGDGRANMYVAPWLAFIPGLAITILVFAAAMFGDGVRDILDPRLKGGTGSYKIKKKKPVRESASR